MHFPPVSAVTEGARLCVCLFVCLASPFGQIHYLVCFGLGSTADILFDFIVSLT